MREVLREKFQPEKVEGKKEEEKEKFQNFYWQNKERWSLEKKMAGEFFSEEERDKIKEIVREVNTIEEEIKKKTGKEISIKKIFFEKEPKRERLKNVVEKGKRFSDLIKYFTKGSILSPKVFSRVGIEDKKPVIYLNLSEFDTSPLKALYPILYSSLIISPKFEKEILPGLKKLEIPSEIKAEIKEVFQMETFELASFIFSKNFLEKETLKKNLEKKMKVGRERIGYIFDLLSENKPSLFKKIIGERKERISGKIEEMLKSILTELSIDFSLFFKEAEILEDKELQEKINKEVNVIRKRKKVEEFFFFNKAKEILDPLKNDFKKKFLSVDLNHWFPPEMPPEFLTKIIEKKAEERQELEGLLEKIKKTEVIYPGLLKEVGEKTIITEEDIEKAEEEFFSKKEK